jgi:hypothetical protein
MFCSRSKLHWFWSSTKLTLQRIGNPLNKWANKLNNSQKPINSQMANKYRKKCPKPLAAQEMQIKTKLRFYLTPVRVAVINNTNNKS